MQGHGLGPVNRPTCDNAHVRRIDSVYRLLNVEAHAVRQIF